MKCNRCLFEEPVVTLKDGYCNLCEMHDRLEIDSRRFDWGRELHKIKSQKRKYHCLIGISGGLDSSLLLEYAVNEGLNPLVIHFDNGWNTKDAEHNIDVMTSKLGVDFIRYSLNRQEYDSLCLSFLIASVSDADIPNDMAMSEMMLRTAKEYGIKYIFNGHNFRTEGSSPLSWSYMDAKYIESVYGNFNEGAKLKSYPLLTFWKQIYYIACGIKQVRPFYYINPEMEKGKERLINLYDWKDYGGKHSENLYTEFIGAYYLPVKFGINKTITYHSAQIRSGNMIRYDILQDKFPLFDIAKMESILIRLGISRMIFDVIMALPIKTHADYKTYHSQFKKWKWLFYVLMKLGFLPYTFYKKYTL